MGTYKTDWQLADTVKPVDYNRLEGNCQQNETDITNHKADYNNPHHVTKAQIGLGNVDNTADVDKPISIAVQAALDNKANKTLDNVELSDFAATAIAAEVANTVPQNMSRVRLIISSTPQTENFYIGAKLILTSIDFNYQRKYIADLSSVENGFPVHCDIIPGLYQADLILPNEFDNSYTFRPSQTINAIYGNTIDLEYTITSKRTSFNIYGVRISKTDADPGNSCEYINGALGFSPSVMSGGVFVDNGWSERWPFNKIKPCVLKNGEVQYYLNPDDYTLRSNGKRADIFSGDDGDVMIEVPKIWYKISEDTNYFYVQIADGPASGYTDYAFSYEGVIKDAFYVGAYKGFINNTKLRSISGKTPDHESLLNFRTAAQSHGLGYEVLPYNKLMLLQVLFLLRFKSLNSQSVIGLGRWDGTETIKATTGTSNKLGFNYGTNTNSAAVKCLGIEDFWGNGREWIEGLGGIRVTVDSTTGLSIRVSDGNFSNTLNSYTQKLFTTSYIGSGVIKTIQANNDLGFLGKTEYTGSQQDDNYFSDRGSYSLPGSSEYHNAVLGSANEPSNYDEGAFAVGLIQNGDDDAGARLCYCG